MMVARRDRAAEVSRRLGRAAVAALVLLSIPALARAESAYSVGGTSPLSIRALIDFRIVPTDTATSWTDRGPGKTRYGGRKTQGGGFEHTTRFALSQVALEVGAALPLDVSLHSQINWEADVDDHGDIENDGWPRLVEAFARREWGGAETGFGGQAGVMNAPFSLEHSGPAWTSPYTLTPSALNTWLWEEPRIIGIELETWREIGELASIDLAGAFGWGSDELGWLLAERGFVLSDFLSGVNSELPVPTGSKESNVFKERDGRPALYAAVRLQDARQIGEFRLGYFNNLGDQGERGNWETRFGTAGVLFHPWSKLDLGFQYMAGKIATKVNKWDSHFYALYPLVSLRHRGHRVSFRYDWFDVDDDEHAAPYSGENGQAVTVAYLFEFRLRHRVGVEYIHVDSDRSRPSDRNRTDDSWQLSYRYRY